MKSYISSNMAKSRLLKNSYLIHNGMYVNLEGLYRLFISYLDYHTFVLFIEYSWSTPNKLSIFMLFYVATAFCPSLTHIQGEKGP